MVQVNFYTRRPDNSHHRDTLHQVGRLDLDRNRRLFLPHYMAGDTPRMLHAGLKAVSHALAVDPPPPALARAYASLSAIMAAVPWNYQGSRYAERAMQVATRLDHKQDLRLHLSGRNS